MLAGTASAQGDSTIGRGFTGVIMSVDIANGFMVVESKTAVFQLLLTEDTVISVHPDKDVGLEGLPITTRYKIAGLADLPITDAGGNVDLDPRTAQKITVIPGNATRSHRRAIAAGIQDDDLTTLDFGGTKTELAGRRDGIEKGEMLIMLIQRSARGDAEEKVRGLFRAQTVDDRLVRLSNAAVDDPLRAGILAEIRDRRGDALELRFRQTAENAGPELRGLILAKMRAVQEGREARRKQRDAGLAEAECIPATAAPLAGDIKGPNAGGPQPAAGECLDPTDPAIDEPPVIRITSPAVGIVVVSKEVVTVTAEAEDDVGVVAVTFNVGGSDVATLTEAPYTVDVVIPADVSQV